jgi:hypothetical protein
MMFKLLALARIYAKYHWLGQQQCVTCLFGGSSGGSKISCKEDHCLLWNQLCCQAIKTMVNTMWNQPPCWSYDEVSFFLATSDIVRDTWDGSTPKLSVHSIVATWLAVAANASNHLHRSLSGRIRSTTTNSLVKLFSSSPHCHPTACAPPSSVSPGDEG